MLCGREGAGRELGLVRERPRASASMERPPSVISVVWVCVCVSYTYRRGVSRRPHVCVHTRPATLQGPSQPASQPAGVSEGTQARPKRNHLEQVRSVSQSVSHTDSIGPLHSNPCLSLCTYVHSETSLHSDDILVLYDGTLRYHGGFTPPILTF